MHCSVLEFFFESNKFGNNRYPSPFIYAFIMLAIFSHVILREVGGIKRDCCKRIITVEIFNM